VRALYRKEAHLSFVHQRTCIAVLALLLLSFTPITASASVSGRASCDANQDDLGRGKDLPSTQSEAWFVAENPAFTEPLWGCLDSGDTTDIFAIDLTIAHRDLVIVMDSAPGSNHSITMHSSDGTKIADAVKKGGKWEVGSSGTARSGKTGTLNLEVKLVDGEGNYSIMATTSPSPPPSCPSTQNDADSGGDAAEEMSNAIDLGHDPIGRWTGCTDLAGDGTDTYRFEVSEDHTTHFQILPPEGTIIDARILDHEGNQTDATRAYGSPSQVSLNATGANAPTVGYLVVEAVSIGYTPLPPEYEILAALNAPPADLIPTAVSHSGHVKGGDVLLVDFTLINNEPAVAVNSSIEAWISIDANLQQGIDISLGRVRIGSINKAASLSFQPAFTVPLGITANWYHLLLEVDVLEEVQETNEMNNVLDATEKIYVGDTNVPCGSQSDAGEAGDAATSLFGARSLGNDPNPIQPIIGCLEDGDEKDLYRIVLTSGTRMAVNASIQRDLRVELELLDEAGRTTDTWMYGTVGGISYRAPSGTNSDSTLYLAVNRVAGRGDYQLQFLSVPEHLCSQTANLNDPGALLETARNLVANPNLDISGCIDSTDEADAYQFSAAMGADILVEIEVDDPRTAIQVTMTNGGNGTVSDTTAGGIGSLRIPSSGGEGHLLIVKRVEDGASYTLRVHTDLPETIRPDLFVQNISAPRVVKPLETIVMEWDVGNSGTTWNHPFIVHILLSTDSLVSSDDVILLKITHVALPIISGSSVSQILDIDLPQEINEEGAFLIVDLDVENDAQETNELNNTDVRFIRLDIPPLDSDNDGLIDGIDDCPGVLGYSNNDRKGCIDSDFDGWSDPTNLWPAHPNGTADAFPYDSTQWKDSDGDGYGDSTVGNQSDQCPNSPGNTNQKPYGCPPITTSSTSASKVAASFLESTNGKVILASGGVLVLVLVLAILISVFRREDDDVQIPDMQRGIMIQGRFIGGETSEPHTLPPGEFRQSDFE